MINKIKNISVILILLTMSLALVSAPIALATEHGSINLTERLVNVGGNAGFSDTTPNIAETAGFIIRALLSLLGIVFMGYIVYAGSLWMTARGDEEKITKAKAIVRGSIIGLVIVMSAYAITAFVLDAVVRGTGFTN